MFSNKWVVLWDYSPVGTITQDINNPCKVDEPNLAIYFSSEKEAKSYIKKMKNEIFPKRNLIRKENFLYTREIQFLEVD